MEEQSSKDNHHLTIEKVNILAHSMGPEIVEIFEHLQHQQATQLESNQSESYSFSFLNFKHIPTESYMCAKALSKSSMGYKCFDCQYVDGAVLCEECFEQSDHQGHNFELYQVGGGCCDCGDEEKWRIEGFCKKHNNKNILEQIKKQIDENEQEQFIKKLGFCFTYYFALCNEAYLHPELYSDSNNIELFEEGLIQYLYEFNKNSLISTVMIFNLFKSKILLEEFELSFTLKASTKSILEIIYSTYEFAKHILETIDLLIEMFPLPEFKKYLTITFLNEYNRNSLFAKSEFDGITCQLLASYKVIPELIETKEITPLIYKPFSYHIHSFDQICEEMQQYYNNLIHLLALYGESSSKYINYHILMGEITSMGYYRQFTSKYEEAINYYGLEVLHVELITTLIKKIKHNQSIEVLEKAIHNLWSECQKVYLEERQELHNKIDENIEKHEEKLDNKIYLTYEIAFGLFIFTYFEKISEHNDLLTEEQKISSLINIITKNNNNNNNNNDSELLKEDIFEMLEVVSNNLWIGGLCMGDLEARKYYESYNVVMFGEELSIMSVIMYLYKILIKMLKYLNKSPEQNQLMQEESNNNSNNNNNNYHIETTLCTTQLLNKLLNKQEHILEFLSLIENQELQEQLPINETLPQLNKITYFLHLLIQLAETNTHELIIASKLEFIHANNHYETNVNKFYLELLKNYHKIPIKEFKKITQSFIPNNHDESFEKFITNNQEILIEKENIILKSSLNNEKLPLNSRKVESELNLFYYKSFKNKLINLEEKEIVFKTPQSSNHFLHEILSEEFVHNLMKMFTKYVELLMKQMKEEVKEHYGEVVHTLGLLAIELIKISKAFEHKVDSKISEMILDELRSLKNNKEAYKHFPEDIRTIISHETAEIKSEEHEKELKKEQEVKIEERKRKLEEKKRKMMSKFKEHHEKCEETYSNELKAINDNLEEEMNEENNPESEKILLLCKYEDNDKKCIICHEEEQNLKPLMLMYLMRINNLYEHIICKQFSNQLSKEQQEETHINMSKNNHLIFTTCGHYIHHECYLQMNTHHIMLDNEYCKLCKSPFNCLFPLIDNRNDKEHNNKIEDSQSNEKYESLKITFSLLTVIENELQKLINNNYENITNESKNCLSINEKRITVKIIDSLTKEIAFSLLHCFNKNNSELLNKRITNIYRHVIHAIKLYENQFNKLEDHEEEQKTESNNPHQPVSELLHEMINQKEEEITHLILKEHSLSSTINKNNNKILLTKKQIELYILRYINRFIIIEDENEPNVVEEEEKTSNHYQLSSECIQSLDYVLRLITFNHHSSTNYLKKEQKFFLSYESPEINLLSQQITIFTPPSTLSELIKLRGKCPRCHKYTNMIQICIICEFKCCKSCNNNSISEHAHYEHCRNSIFIDTNIGEITVFLNEGYRIYDSVYEDYLGESYKEYKLETKLNKFTLNKKLYQKYINMIFEYKNEL